MTETWDESKPAGSRSPNLGDDDIREFKRAIRERLAEDHIFESTESPAFGAGGGYDIGKHKFITLVQRNTSKVTASDEVAMMCKEISGNPEVILTPPSAGTDRQLTKNAATNLNLNSGDFENYLIKAGFYDTGSINASTSYSDIANFGVRTAQLDSGSVTTDKIPNFSLGSSQLNTGAIDSDRIANDSILHKHQPRGSNIIFSDFESATRSTASWADVKYVAILIPASGAGILRFTHRTASTGGTGGAIRWIINGETQSQQIISGSWTIQTATYDISGLTINTLYVVTIQLYANTASSVELRGTIFSVE